MTNSLRLITLIMAMSLMTAAHGQDNEWFVAPSFVFMDDDPDRVLDDEFGGLQVTAGMNLTEYLSLEGLLGYSNVTGYCEPGDCYPDQKLLDISANLLAFYDRDATFAPYALIGLGYLGKDADEGPQYVRNGGTDNRPSVSLGLGFKWRLGEGPYSIRGEYRRRSAYRSDNYLNDQLLTLGVQYDFAGPDFFGGDGGSATSPQGFWGEWNMTGSIVYNDDDPDRRIDDGVSGIQLAAGWDFNDWLTLEGRLTYSDIGGFYREPPGPYIRGSETQVDLGAHALFFYDREARFAPYAMLGVGYQSANLNFGGKEQNPTASVGAGFNWKLGQSRFLLRTELSSRWTMDGGSNRTFNDFAATLGVQYSFGDRRRDPGRPDLPQDSDGDGVLDMWDECPDTPQGVAVTAKGCEIKEIDRDSDNDRVPDSRDKCPNTPTGIAVDADGCSLDSDRDGVPTAIDRCPGSIAGGLVDEFGCGDDDDGDRVRNMVDRCPDSRWRAEVDPYGCEIRDVISLPGVNFQSGSDLLLAGAENLIRDIASTLNANDYLQIEVAGHTDSQGSDANNQGLSDRRAKTVFDYLIMYGVDEDRLSFRGYGESQPIADNETADGRATNRRVELRVVRR